MKNKLKGLLVMGALAALVFAPFVFAQPADYVEGGNQANISCDALKEASGTTLMYMLCRVSLLLNTLIPILITLGVVYFIYGVISYAIAKDDEAKTAGRGAMIAGLIALLVIVSMWGLITILKRTFGVTDSAVIAIPCIASPGIKCP